VLELAILGLLKESDLHGYELKKRLTEALGPFSSVSFGSLYPALARLEAAGAVKAVDARDAVPEIGSPSLGAELAAFRAWHAGPTGRRGGRSRKVYGITAVGHRLFQELLAADDASTEDDRLFNLRLAFARYLPADARLGLLERRRAALVERLAAARQRMRLGRDRLDSYTTSLMEHQTVGTEQDISWLDRLIAAEHDAASRQKESEQ